MLLIIGGPFSEGLSPSGCRESCTNRSASGGPREVHWPWKNTEYSQHHGRKEKSWRSCIMVLWLYNVLPISILIDCIVWFCSAIPCNYCIHSGNITLHSVGACHCCTFGNTPPPPVGDTQKILRPSKSSDSSRVFPSFSCFFGSFEDQTYWTNQSSRPSQANRKSLLSERCCATFPQR